MDDEIQEVTAYTDNLTHDYIEAEDLGIALVKFKNRGYGIIEGATIIYPQNLEETLYLFGETGTVKAGGKSVNVIEEWAFADQADDPAYVKETFHENPPNVYGASGTPRYTPMCWRPFGRTGRPYITAEDGKRALELVLAIYKSAAEKRIVKFPLTDTATLDFTGRFAK